MACRVVVCYYAREVYVFKSYIYARAYNFIFRIFICGTRFCRR